MPNFWLRNINQFRTSTIHTDLTLCHLKSELLYDWWFTTNQLVLVPSPLRLTTRVFLEGGATEPSCFWSLCNILSDERMGLSLMNVLGLLSSICIACIACYWKFFLLRYVQVLCQSRLYRADHAYLTYLMLQWQLSHLNGHKLDHRQV
jgi:hypothetical protein